MENKRYLKKFNTQSDYESQKGEIMGTPHIVLLEDTKEIVFASEKETPSDPFNGYEYVDLGLPSGTLWATQPITNANGEPLYFQWGDTEGWTAEQIQNGEKAFTWESYKWYNDGDELSKYNSIDKKTTLDLEDDAAHVHMGGDWHMPTLEQYDELLANTNAIWVTINNIEGIKFSSKINENYIFLPAYGNFYETNLELGDESIYWINTLYYGKYAWFTLSDKNYIGGHGYLGYGCCVGKVIWGVNK